MKISSVNLSYILTKEKYEVTEAANGKVAFDMLKETSFDLVITDLEMPEMKGIELLDEIKKMNLQTKHDCDYSIRLYGNCYCCSQRWVPAITF